MGEFLAAVLGGAIGAGLTALYSYFMFYKQQHIERFVSIVDEIDSALVLAERRELYKEDSLERKEVTNDIELNLNKAFSKSMVFLDDPLFRRAEAVVTGKFDKTGRNDLYYHFRKKIYPRTTITLDDIKTKFIKLSAPPSE